jgi:stress-induced-phosphoprotein 1
MSDDDIKKAEEIKQKGNVLFKQRNFKGALELYTEAKFLNPSEITYYLNMAGCEHALGNYDAVIENCEYVVEETYNFEKKCKALGRMGYAYQEKKDYEKAIECFEKAMLEQKDQRIKEALRDVSKLKKLRDEQQYLDPQKAEEANASGNDKFKKQDYVNALKEYTEAIKRDPSVPKYFSNRAAVYIKLLSLNEALMDCEKALELKPDFLRAHQRHCNVQVLMKRYHKALKSYENALKMFPNDSEIKEGYQKCVMKINEGGDDQERLQQTMNDPEIQGLMVDPRVQQFLKDLKENPNSANEKIMKDEFLREAFRKLVAAGIIKTK